MDITKTITHVSLCAGYGGIDLGLKRAIPNLRTIAFSEIEAFACANLVAKMEAGFLDAAPIWTNLKTFPWDEFRDCVDILSGGYPCQPFSAAGKRLGTEDPRHLWPYIADGIIRMRPRICFFENVEGHITLGLRDVLHDLAGMGYRTTFGIFSASEVGAPHQRKRVFILAHRHSQRGQLPDQWRQPAIEMPVSNGKAGGDGVAESKQPRPQRRSSESMHTGGLQCETGRGCCFVWPSRPGEPQHGWEPPRVVGNTASKRSAAQWAESKGQQREASITSASDELGDASQREDHRREPRNMGGEAGQRRCGDHAVDGSGKGVGYATNKGQSKWGSGALGESKGTQSQPQRSDSGSNNAECQIEPTLGRDPDGRTDRLDDAELYVTCDNRTDELRLLGNGVVPATAHKAFITLMETLT